MMPSPNNSNATDNGGDSSNQSKTPTTTNGLRKQLPPVPDLETQKILNDNLANKKHIISASPLKNNYGTYFLEYSLLAEYGQLQKQKLPGIYVIPSYKSPLHWFGMLSIRQGPYQGGMFRFTLYIPETYPDGDAPRVVFEPAVFHPIVDFETGELDVKRAFKNWKKNVHHIWQVLLYARRIFYKIDTKEPLNDEAANLFEQNLVLFQEKVTQSLLKCRETLLEPPDVEDPYCLRFDDLNDDEYEESRKKMLQSKMVKERPQS